MDPFTGAALISAGANILSGIIGGNAAEEQARKAEQMINDSIARIEALKIPDITKKIIYDQYMSVGDFNPQMLDKVIEENAPLALMHEDPRYKAKMESNLAKQEQSTMGPTAQGRLAMEKARRSTAQDVLAQMASIESQAKRTGTYGSGAALASKLKEAQAGADRSAIENMQIAGQEEQQQSTNLDNFIRNLASQNQQSMDVQSQNVRARNMRDELLMQNAMARERANKGAMNEANLRNLQEKQRAFDANTGINIGEQRRIGYEAPMQMYNMNLAKLDSENALRGKLADVYTGRGAAQAQMWSNIGSGVGKMASAAFYPEAFQPQKGQGFNPLQGLTIAPQISFGGGYPQQPSYQNYGVPPSNYQPYWYNQQSFQNPNYNENPGVPSDITLKENIEHIGNDNRTGLPVYDFNYKGDTSRYRGVMAQDVEKVYPQAVATINGKKHVDYNMLGMKLYKLT